MQLRKLGEREQQLPVSLARRDRWLQASSSEGGDRQLNQRMNQRKGLEALPVGGLGAAFNNTKLLMYNAEVTTPLGFMEPASTVTSAQPARLVCLPGGNQRANTPSGRPVKSQAIQPFQPEDAAAQSAIAPQDRFQIDLHRLETQARRVNELSAELEQTLWELKAIASQVNLSSIPFREQFGHHWFPAEICAYHSVELPTLRQQDNGQLVLASRSLDLLAAEREASELAAKLRQRSNRKRKRAAKPTAAETAAPAAPTDTEPAAEPPKRRRKSTKASSRKKQASSADASSSQKTSETQPKTTTRRKKSSSSAAKTTRTRKTTARRKPAATATASDTES